MTVTFRHDMVGSLEAVLGNENTILGVARVDPSMDNSPVGAMMSDRDFGLLKMLIRDRHGTPFESVVFRFYVECPIFVAREFLRHRIASYNETSARYRAVYPEFYVPSDRRPLMQIGKPGAYRFEAGSEMQVAATKHAHKHMAIQGWEHYTRLLEKGVAREVARNVLPVSLYTSFFVTINLRSLLNFLSLRRVNENTTVPTFPLYEMDQVAGLMETAAERELPRVFALFNQNGRVSP